jgi:hypothetical protein
MAISPNEPASGPTSTGAVSDEWHTYLFNRASWGAIIAGVVAALVVQLLLNLLGIGVGAASLSAANLADNPDASAFSIGSGIWWTLSGIIASFCGGAVAGRLCGAAKVNTARWHGFVAWCVTTLVIFYLLTSAIGSIVGGSLSALGNTLGGAARSAASTVSGAVQSGDAGGLEARVRGLVNPTDTQSVQNNLLNYIRASASGNQQAADAARDQAVDGLARVANISPDEARNRLNQVEEQYRQVLDQAKQRAARAAETARRTASQAGIFGFIALVIGAVAAWFGGGIGTPRQSSVVFGPSGRRI